MGALTLGQNSVSHRLRTQLSRTTNAYSQNLQRLSSGSRINHASDDAAGLAVATKLAAHTRIYGQAIRNLNDGISAINVAEGGLGQMYIIATRLRETAEQSANGVMSTSQREALDEEASALIAEYNRIVGSTKFNKRQLLDGTLSELALQLGFGNVNVSIGSNITRSVTDGGFDAALTTGSGSRSYGPAVGDLNGDGLDDNVSTQVTGVNTTTVYIQISNGDGTFTETTRTLTATNGQIVEVGDTNNDGRLDIVVWGYRTTASYGMRLDYMLGNGDGTFGTASVSTIASFTPTVPTFQSFVMADMNGDNNLDAVYSYRNEDLGISYFGIRYGNGAGAFTSGANYTATLAAAIEAVDLNGDNRRDLVFSDGASAFQILNDGSGGLLTETLLVAGGVSAIDSGDVNEDGITDVIASGSSGVRVYLSSGSGSNPLSLDSTLSGSTTNGRLTDLDGDGFLDVITSSSTYFGNGDGSFNAAVSHTATPSAYWELADVNGDGVDDIVSNGASVGIAAMLGSHETTTTQATVSIATQEEAEAAIDTFSTLLDNISREIGVVGSSQSRLRFALNNLFVTRDGYGIASSRIRDADLAQETAQMIRNQVLQSTDQALLAQANQSSKIVLELLSEVENLPEIAP